MSYPVSAVFSRLQEQTKTVPRPCTDRLRHASHLSASRVSHWVCLLRGSGLSGHYQGTVGANEVFCEAISRCLLDQAVLGKVVSSLKDFSTSACNAVFFFFFAYVFWGSVVWCTSLLDVYIFLINYYIFFIKGYASFSSNKYFCFKVYFFIIIKLLLQLSLWAFLPLSWYISSIFLKLSFLFVYGFGVYVINKV
jgi:hypothetical protein